MPKLPVILTAFANSYDTTYLSQLGQELNSLQKTLAPLSYLRHVPLSGARTRHLVDTLNQYKEELLIFHFGGHADGEELMFEDKAGKVSGLAELFSLHPQLKLVFLNGCNTQSQAIQYIDLGIPAVIATTFSIEDGKARLFAEVFYEALVNGHTLQEAFILAKGTIKLDASNVPTNEILPIIRGLRLRKKAITEAPWRLYARDNVLNFKLTDLQNLPKTKRSKKGLVLYKIPKTMQLQRETQCIVRIAINEEILMKGTERDADTIIEPNIGVSNRMEAKLIDPSRTPAFSIRSTNEPIQLINDDSVTAWKFYVTPLIVGQHELELKVIIIKKMGSESVRHETTFDEKIVIEAEGVSDEEIGFVATDVSIETSYNNRSEITGNDNIALQDANNSSITINNPNYEPPISSPNHGSSTENSPKRINLSPKHLFLNFSITDEQYHPNYELKSFSGIETINKRIEMDAFGKDVFDLLLEHADTISILQINSLKEGFSIFEGAFKEIFALLTRLKNLQVVILNCCKLELGLKLLQIGIPGVIISAQHLEDAQSRIFLDSFYQKIVSEDTLREAYQFACLRAEEKPNVQIFSGRMDNHPFSLYVNDEKTLRYKLDIDRPFDSDFSPLA